MIDAIKIFIILGILLLLAYPLIPAKGVLSKLFPASALRYNAPHNRKNFFFVILVVLEFVLAVILFRLFDTLSVFLASIPIIGRLFTGFINSFSSQFDFILFTLSMVCFNLIFLYAYIFLKAFLKAILDSVFELKPKKQKKEKKKKNKKNKKGEIEPPIDEDTPKDDKNDEDASKDSDDDLDYANKKKNSRIPGFLHSDESNDHDDDDIDLDSDDDNKNDPPEIKEQKRRYGKVARFIYGMFFEGEDFEKTRPWAIRVRTVLQCFIAIVYIIYTLFLITVMLSAFFELPQGLYKFLVDVIHIGNWYIYPILSLLFLQELCNFLKTPYISPPKDEEQKKQKEKKKEQTRLEARLRKLLGELKRHFDSEHSLRFYPEAVQQDIAEYEPQNRTYKSALLYIKARMKAYSGRVVQSYMQCLDACFGDNHVYFASSFYSELGAYLIAYTHIRLLSGSRMIFVVSDPEECATLRSFLSERLMELSGTSATNSWRIHTASERLDQADILIACPKDFTNNNIIAQYPAFFEEVCNAVFLDCDRMISMDSYLCPVMATRLQKATENRVRFIFLTRDLYKGFAARSLPKFFCCKNVHFFSSAKENESVSYVLWNKESKSHRIYNENGQKTTCLEYMIADLAAQHGIDGIRLVTESPLDHAECKLLRDSGVEINKFYRDVVDVNYMIYSDDYCNLASSIYSCTRFRGQKKSVVHIISKPYLLREYFISKAATENFVNRSSFIQPRVPEHIDEHKLSLLRIFCDAADEQGLPLREFERRVREVITVCTECRLIVASAYCRKLLEEKKPADFTAAELAAYLVAGLCDNDLDKSDQAVAESDSYGHKAKEFYLIFDPSKNDGYSLKKDKYIVFNKEKAVFKCLFACNERVNLCLNDEIIGQIDTFPIRTHLEYVAGQSILFKNSEYEIEHISDDGKTIYLRSENVKLSHCLDTVHLRRYTLSTLTPIEKRVGILNNTKLTLEEIRVSECVASFVGETYGFYGLSSDKQTLDFYHKDGVDGNPHLSNPNSRNITDGRILKVDLISRMECTDGMRMLLSAACNEFIKTLFPGTYRTIAIVPVLEAPLPYDCENEPKSEAERIEALYPYLVHPTEEFIETDKKRITLLFINDCFENVGAFQWFYDLSGRYMQEFLANVYSYLYWLNKRPERNHYINFGGEGIPACFDLDGCCKLLEGYNRVLAELSDKDIEIAGDDTPEDSLDRCAFCHCELETGRYSLFDKQRYICADCFEVVDSLKQQDELHSEMRAYLMQKYPFLVLGPSKAQLDPLYELRADQVLSENYYRVDLAERTIYTERDNPINNVRVSLLRGLIELWQSDNQLITDYSIAQLYYEELVYLLSKDLKVSASWIYHALPEDLRKKVDEISEFTGVSVAPVKPIHLPLPTPTPDEPNAPENGDEDGIDDIVDSLDGDDKDDDGKDGKDNDKKDAPPSNERKTSFDFIRIKYEEEKDDDDKKDDNPFFEDDDNDGLYDPNKIPRFWKRYLRNQHVDDGKNEDIKDAENPEEDDDDSPNASFISFRENDAPNAPPEGDDVTPAGDDPLPIPSDDDKKADKDKKGLFGKKEKKDKKEKEKKEKPKKEKPKKDDIMPKKDDEIPKKAKGEKPKKDDKTPKEKKEKPKKGLTYGERVMPYEDDEKTNPRIKIYNEIVRRAYDYSLEPIEMCGFSSDQIMKIIDYVRYDYPELFWLQTGLNYNGITFTLMFRCLDVNGKLDTKQVDRKRRELKKAAKEFTRGITKRTDPYEALLTIYRRLILCLDYDTIGLRGGAGKDKKEDDTLRSLHSALVEHKVVCAGYAVAMQYLLQSVGIVCAYTVSEFGSDNTNHAFNILKLGKYCYYLDSTWGDWSDTSTGTNKDLVNYGYVCVPYNEFLQTHPEQRCMHIPNKEKYPSLETFNYTNHEYYRYHNAYLRTYNEDEITRIIADAAKRYDKKEMGVFNVSMRFPTEKDGSIAKNKLLSNGNLSRLMGRAKDSLKKKEHKKLLEGSYSISSSYNGVITINIS